MILKIFCLLKGIFNEYTGCFFLSFSFWWLLNVSLCIGHILFQSSTNVTLIYWPTAVMSGTAVLGVPNKWMAKFSVKKHWVISDLLSFTLVIRHVCVDNFFGLLFKYKRKLPICNIPWCCIIMEAVLLVTRQLLSNVLLHTASVARIPTYTSTNCVANFQAVRAGWVSFGRRHRRTNRTEDEPPSSVIYIFSIPTLSP